MEEKEVKKVTTYKDWITFIIFVLVIFGSGVFCGFLSGRNHPSVASKEEWLSDIREEVYKLEHTYKGMMDEYRINKEIQDSIIYALKREIAKGEDVEIPVKVYINFVDNDTKQRP